MSLENIPFIHNKRNYHELEKEYRQTAQDYANDAIECAKSGDWNGYSKAQERMSKFSELSKDFGQKAEKFNN